MTSTYRTLRPWFILEVLSVTVITFQKDENVLVKSATITIFIRYEDSQSHRSYKKYPVLTALTTLRWNQTHDSWLCQMCTSSTLHFSLSLYLNCWKKMCDNDEQRKDGGNRVTSPYTFTHEHFLGETGQRPSPLVQEWGQQTQVWCFIICAAVISWVKLLCKCKI